MKWYHTCGWLFGFRCQIHINTKPDGSNVNCIHGSLNDSVESAFTNGSVPHFIYDNNSWRAMTQLDAVCQLSST